MLNARSCVSTAGKTLDRKTTASAEIFFQWGISESDLKTRQREAARELGRPIVYVEDGFIRSIDIGLSQEPGLSIILDDTTAYYDAGKVSRLSRLYENGPELSEAQIQRSRAVIKKIVDGKVSKYNHAPDLPLKIGKPERRKILLIDQRYGDESVTAGMGSEAAFHKMLMDAIQHNPDCDILVKQHPDAIKGGKSSYFSNERLAFTQYMDNVFPILFDVNPYSLFNIVDEVYVMTSGMGFEALMAGKKVHCYGMPFYAGWGATIDKQSLPSRTRTRSIEEIFYFSYIESSRYYSPKLEKAAEIEDVIDYILESRGW
jgi:capsule polysaccharide export protein KpsC/LpsZ